MKKIVTILAVCAGALALAGCGIQEGSESSSHYPVSHYTFVQELPDGDSVLCVWAKDGYGGGLSCDWEGASR